MHALKHALRFGAEVEAIVTPDEAELRRLLAELAPDVQLPVAPVPLDAGAWTAVSGRKLPSPSLASARRPDIDAAAVLGATGRVVALEQPRHLGNLGAVIRVAAAADASGVLVVGSADPWHPTAVRAAAGLQYAVPVARTDALPPTDRPLVAVDPGGTPLSRASLPSDAVLVIGTERAGLSDALRGRATARIGIPMRSGVSSLNLATAVAVLLYHP